MIFPKPPFSITLFAQGLLAGFASTMRGLFGITKVSNILREAAAISLTAWSKAAWFARDGFR
jgi:hypothetical protein